MIKSHLDPITDQLKWIKSLGSLITYLWIFFVHGNGSFLISDIFEGIRNEKYADTFFLSLLKPDRHLRWSAKTAKVNTVSSSQITWIYYFYQKLRITCVVILITIVPFGSLLFINSNFIGAKKCSSLCRFFFVNCESTGNVFKAFLFWQAAELLRWLPKKCQLEVIRPYLWWVYRLELNIKIKKIIYLMSHGKLTVS